MAPRGGEAELVESRALPAPLVSADRQLLAAGLAESPAAFAVRLGLVDPP